VQRVTDEILSLVPEPKTFRTALRAIKLWATRRAIYANIVGYPGGVAWAMLVARVCQFYPAAVGATLVDRFFFIMHSWKWPTPVMLKDIEQPKPEQASQGFKVWNPAIYKQDKLNLMPIITPAFPSMCATFNITESTKKIIIKEIERASVITRNIFAKEAEWKDLFKKHTFFTADHKYYLAVVASAFSADAAKKWSGLVESKVRHLVMRVEEMKDIDLARPFTKGFKRVHKCKDEEQIREVQRGSMKFQTEETKTVETSDPELVTTNGNATPMPLSNGDSEKDTDSHTIYTYTYYIGINTHADFKGSLNLIPPFHAFKSICQGWSGYEAETHFLNLAVYKSWDLPEDLFDSTKDEKRPARPVKKGTKAAGADAKPVRRSINEVEVRGLVNFFACAITNFE
jgi:poly(A) polymerase